MEALKITNFKAHQDLEEIKFNQKNFLLYGDNGAGKSSIYEALKLCFFKDRVEKYADMLQVKEFLNLPVRKCQSLTRFPSLVTICKKRELLQILSWLTP